MNGFDCTHPVQSSGRLVEGVGRDLQVRAQDVGHHLEELAELGLLLQPGDESTQEFNKETRL